MAGVRGGGVSRGDEGLLGREARTQYRVMAGLRWSMFMNGLRTIDGPLELGPTGISWMIYATFGLLQGLVLFAAADSLATSGRWAFLPALCWGVSVLWLMFAVFVTSFQEHPELGILLRFPIGFGPYFVLHCITAATDASTIVGAISCAGLWLGIVVVRPDLWGWTALGLAGLMVFNLLLTRAVLSWVDRWLTQRKTREIVGAAFMVLLVVLLVGNSIWNSDRMKEQKHQQGAAMHLREWQAEYGPLLEAANRIQEWLPPGLSARTVQASAGQNDLASLETLGLAGLWVALAGGVLAGRLRAQYHGQDLSWAPQRSDATEDGGGWTLGGSRPLMAMVEKEVRTLLRTVPWLWAMSMPLLLVLVVAGAFHSSPGHDAKTFPYAYLLCVGYALAGFTGLLYNLLGTEGAGIQLLFLSPMSIRTVLLAKNLLHSVLYVAVGVAAGALVCVRLGVPPVVVLADTGAWILFMLPCNLAAGIMFSLTVPYRINPGRITRPAGSMANTLPAMLIQLGVLGAGALVFWFSWYLQDRWLPVPVFLVLAAGAFLVWTRVLHFSDDNAMRRRDLLIATLMKAD